MKFVDPIRNVKKLRKMGSYLKKKSPRDYMLFLLGMYSALKMSDILKLQVSDVMLGKRTVIKKFKLSRGVDSPLRQSVRKELLEYVTKHCEGGYLFPSRTGDSHIGRQQAYLILNDAARQAGIAESVGAQVLRKTSFYWAYKGGTSLEVIQKALGHGSVHMTVQYLGLTFEDLEEAGILLDPDT